MRLSTGFTTSLMLLAVFMLAACDKSTPTFAGSTTAADDKSAVATVADSPVPVAISDANISHDVKTALLGDEELKNIDITVVSTKGDVLLTGVLNNQSQINQAIGITRAVVGFKTVHDELTLRP
jgi:hyperosmotically inducible protein